MRTALLAAIVLAYAASAALADFTGKVVSVAAGDTITVLREGREQVKVRLDGNDAPERGQSFDDAAKRSLPPHGSERWSTMWRKTPTATPRRWA